MKLTQKQINEVIAPSLHKLDVADQKVKAAVDDLLARINGAFAKTNGPAIFSKLQEVEAALKEIELKRMAKQLREALDNVEIEMEPVITDIERIPEELRHLFKPAEKAKELEKV